MNEPPSTPTPRLTAPTLRSELVTLTPLRADDADALAPVLADARLHRFTGGEPPSLAELQARCARQARGRSPDGGETWLNWTVRPRPGDPPVGIVQATIADRIATLAWVIGTAYQGRGLATAAARLMARWCAAQELDALRAHIHPEHLASIAVACAIGLRDTGVIVDGERRWEIRIV